METLTKITILTIAILLGSCKNERETENHEKDELTYIQPPAPPGFDNMMVPPDNPLSKEGIALGRKLYYDNRLSKNGPLEGASCSSCHIQENGFGIGLPVGNMPPIPHINLAWSQHFLWNGEEPGPLENVMRFEVEDFFKTDLDYINTLSEYIDAFKKVYGVNEIDYEHLAKALSQFFRMLNSYNSPFDKWKNHGGSLTTLELHGQALFFSEDGDCFHCHGGPLFTDGIFHNTGLDAVSNPGSGRESYTGHSYDRGVFKTPTLRNVALRSPYMHDGRFSSLREVIEFYNSGVHDNPNLSPILSKTGGPQRLNLSEYDKNALEAFLLTLTDEEFVTDPNLGPPN
ncbi:MAG: cytochrome-c peroxidase [Cryomorphaceae bacterium]|nr:cytochrome-c peroxidase [Cryomorphaceae bacterium]